MKRAVALLVGTLAGLLLAELIVRLASDHLLGLAHPTVQFDPELGWVQRAGETAVRRNEAGQEVVISGSRLGIRQPPRPYEFEGRESVLLVGDSFTAGTQVRFEDTWGARLEERLRRRRPRVQVVNAGIDRYDLAQGYRLARRLWDTVRPQHLVVAVYLGNDLADYETHAQARPPWRAPTLAARLRERSYLYHFVAGALSRSRRAAAADERPPARFETWSPKSVPGFAELRPDQQARIRGQFASGDVLPALQGGDEAERRFAAAEKILSAFLALAKERGIGMTLVLLPMKQEVIPQQRAEWVSRLRLSEDDVARPHARLMRWAADHGVAAVDVTPSLRMHDRPAELFWHVDMHMTPLGHALTAEVVEPAVEEGWGSGGAE